MKRYTGLGVLLFLLFLLYGCSSYVPPTAISPTSAMLTDAPSPSSLTGRYYPSGAIGGPFLDLLPGGNAYYSPRQFSITHNTFEVNGNQIIFSGVVCNQTSGSYHWSLEQDVLKLGLVSDSCADRTRFLLKTFKKLPEQFPYVNVVWDKLVTQTDFSQATVDAAGNFYVNDGLGGTYKYNPDGTFAKNWKKLSYTTGIVADEKGNMYIANLDDAAIHKFDATGNPVLAWKVDSGSVGPMGLSRDSKGNIYVILQRIHNHYVEKYSPDGKLLATWAKPGVNDGQIGADPQGGPAQIAVDAEGNSYLSDTLNNRLVKYDPNGKFLYNLTGDGKQKLVQPVDVAVDSKGNVYTISLQTLWKFDKAGHFVGAWFTPNSGNIVIDSKDDIFLINPDIMKIELPSP